MVITDTILSPLMFAMGPAPQPGSNQPPGWVNIVPMALMIVIFYFVLIRPQQKKAKEHDLLMKGLKSGDRIVTSSGIVGIVISVKDRSVSIRSADSKLEVTKASVAEVTERAAGAASEA